MSTEAPARKHLPLLGDGRMAVSRCLLPSHCSSTAPVAALSCVTLLCPPSAKNAGPAAKLAKPRLLMASLHTTNYLRELDMLLEREHDPLLQARTRRVLLGCATAVLQRSHHKQPLRPRTFRRQAATAVARSRRRQAASSGPEVRHMYRRGWVVSLTCMQPHDLPAGWPTCPS